MSSLIKVTPCTYLIKVTPYIYCQVWPVILTDLPALLFRWFSLRGQHSSEAPVLQVYSRRHSVGGCLQWQAAIPSGDRCGHRSTEDPSQPGAHFGGMSTSGSVLGGICPSHGHMWGEEFPILTQKFLISEVCLFFLYDSVDTLMTIVYSRFFCFFLFLYTTRIS